MIFAAIAIAWLAYLVPHFVRRRNDDPGIESDPADRFSENVYIVRHGTAPLLDQDLAPIAEYEVSTPLTRRAGIADLRRLDRLAATRRRRVLLGLMALISAVIGMCAVDWLPWWSVAVPGGMLVAFFVAARISVHLMRRSLDDRYHAIMAGGHEKTVFLSRKKSDDTAEEQKPADKPVAEEPKPVSGALWDPVPITMPTYVSKPLAPRTVRTIDLSGPDVISSRRPSHPVVADVPETAAADESGHSDEDGATARTASA